VTSQPPCALPLPVGPVGALRESDDSRIVVLGIGNTLLTDEGLGPQAVERLRHQASTHLELVDGGTLSYSLVPVVAEADALIVIDAARLGLPPGLDRLLRSRLVTAHEVGLKELFDMARLSGHLPRLRALIAVEPEVIDWGMALSPKVEVAMERVLLLVQATAHRWQRRIPLQ
jgi:hydrogenase maturation protease